MTGPWPISHPLSPAGKLGQEAPVVWLVDRVVEPGIGPIDWLEVEDDPGDVEDGEVLTYSIEVVVVDPGIGPMVDCEEDVVLTYSGEEVVVVEPGSGSMLDCELKELLEKSGIDVDKEEKEVVVEPMIGSLLKEEVVVSGIGSSVVEVVVKNEVVEDGGSSEVEVVDRSVGPTCCEEVVVVEGPGIGVDEKEVLELKLVNVGSGEDVNEVVDGSCSLLVVVGEVEAWVGLGLEVVLGSGDGLEVVLGSGDGLVVVVISVVVSGDKLEVVVVERLEVGGAMDVELLVVVEGATC